MVVASGDRGPAGLGSRRRPDRHGARLDLEDETAVGAGVDERQPAEPAHRADHREGLVVGSLAADRAGRVDEGVAPAVGEPDREDGSPPGPISATRGPSSKVDLGPRLGRPGRRASRAPGRSGTASTTPSRMRTGRKPIRTPQSGITKMDVTSRIWVQISFSTSTIFTAASYQSHPPWEPCGGCLAWSSRRVRASTPGGPSRPGRRRSEGR